MPDDEKVENIALEEGEEGDVKIFGGELLEDEPVEKEEEPKEEEPKEEEELESKEEEPKEEEEEELPQVSGRTRPTYKELTTKYPNLFKDFPDLRHVFFREKEFTERFGDVSEADEVIERSKDFEYFEEKITSGDAKSLLETIKDNGTENLTQFAGNFLPALREVSNDTFIQVTAPIVQSVLTSAFSDGDRNGNDNLKNAALYVAKYVFGDYKYATGEVKVPTVTKEDNKPNKEREELERERSKFTQERYQVFDRDVKQESFEELRDSILDGLDPDDTMTDFTKRHIVEDTMSEIDKLMVSDSTHMNKMNLLWKQAERRGFDSASRARIISTYLARGRSIMPDVRRKVKSIALRGKLPPEKKEASRELTGGRTSSNGKSRRPSSAREVDWRKTSDEDLFAGNVAYKS